MSSKPEFVEKTLKSTILVKDKFALKIRRDKSKEIDREYAYGFYASQKYPQLFVRHLALTTDGVIFLERCEGDFLNKYSK